MAKRGTSSAHHAGEGSRKYGLPANWKTIESYRYYINRQLERLARDEIRPHQMAAMTAAVQTATNLFMIAATQRQDDAGLEVIEDEPALEPPSDEVEIEYEDVTAEIVRLPAKSEG